MIDHRHRCIFVHIPKTAGNSVNRVFGVDWQDHKDAARYASEVGPETFAEYYKFAIVRNPWERLFSDYNYQRKKSRERDSKLFLFKEDGTKRDFAEWVEAVFANPFRYEARSWGGEVSPGIHRWSPQVDWMTLNGRIVVNAVIRLEHLPEDFERVCRALKLPAVHLPHRNGRFHLHYSHYYTEATRERVAEYYRQDVEAFGYRFEPGPISRVERAWGDFTAALATRVSVSATEATP